MFVLTIFGTLMMYFLPGYALLSLLYVVDRDKFKLSFFMGLLVVIIFSLLLNYFAVYSLCALHLYKTKVLYALGIAEILFILAINKFKNCKFITPPPCKCIGVNSFLLYFTVLLYLFTVFTTSPKIFSAWDDVVSWNRWSASFYNATIPLGTWHYPQALPAQWSIFYRLCRAPLEFLPKATVPLYLYCTALALLERKSYAASFLLLIYFYLTKQVHTGYVDIPVSCIAFASLLFLEDAHKENNFTYLVIGAIIACTSSLVKQAGLYIVAMYPILALVFFKFSSKGSRLKFLVLYLFIVIITAGFFYAYTQYNILRGRNSSEISYVTNGIYNGVPFYKRMFPAFVKFFTGPKILLLLLLPFIFFQETKIRLVYGIVGFVYLTVWSAFYSYDLRNGYLAWPMIIYSECSGVQYVFNKHKNKLLECVKNNKSYRTLLVCAMLVCIVLVGTLLTKPKSALLASQEKEKMKRGGNIAVFIENFYKVSGETSSYISNYQPLYWISEDSLARKKYVFSHLANLEQDLQKIRDEDIHYIYVSGGAALDFYDYVNEKIKEGVFTVLYDGGERAKFIKIEDMNAL